MMHHCSYNIAGYAGFGSYLLAMSYQAYLNTGGAPKGEPGYDPSERGPHNNSSSAGQRLQG